MYGLQSQLSKERSRMFLKQKLKKLDKPTLWCYKELNCLTNVNNHELNIPTNSNYEEEVQKLFY